MYRFLKLIGCRKNGGKLLVWISLLISECMYGNRMFGYWVLSSMLIVCGFRLIRLNMLVCCILVM